MTKAGSTDGLGGPGAAAREARAERLAAALKANLRRRKEQVRERAAEASEPGTDSKPAKNPDQGCS